MNAIELLIKEHNKVRELLAEIEAESQLFKKKINLFNK